MKKDLRISTNYLLDRKVRRCIMAKDKKPVKKDEKKPVKK